MFEKYNEKARRALFFARYEASKLGSKVIESEHLLLGILREGEDIIKEIFSRFNVKPEEVRREIEGDRIFVERISSTAELPLSEESKKILAYASHEAESMMHPYVGTEHLLIGLLRVDGCVAGRLLTARGFNLYGVREETISLIKEREVSKQKKELPFLAEYSRDLTQLATGGGFDPLIGREKEVERIIQILSRRTKNNPILLGEPGVGKTAIVEGLATRIVEGAVPMFLAQKKILALDLSLIVAGTKYRGQFEERLKGIIRELRENPDLIIFIDEIHSLIGAGSAEGSLDAANILKPALSRGEVSCIGATTLKEYRKYIEKDRSLLRRFQAINVTAPSEIETFEILEGVKDRYEQFHKVRYSAEAIKTAVYQSNRYITDRFFPDKAIDLLDEAGAKVKLKRVADTQNLRKLEVETRQIVKEMKKAISDKDFEKAVFLREREIELKEEIERTKAQTAERSDATQEVTRRDIEEIISSWTGIPGRLARDGRGGEAPPHGRRAAPPDRRPGGGDHRRLEGDPPLAARRQQPEPADGLVHLPRPLGRREDRGRAAARRVPLREPEVARPLRHVRVHGEARGLEADRVAPGLRRARGRRAADGADPPQPLQRDPVRRDREGAPRHRQPAAPDPRGRHPDGRLRQRRRLQEHAHHHDVEHRDEAPRQPQPARLRRDEGDPEQQGDRGPRLEGAQARLLARVHQPDRRDDRVPPARPRGAREDLPAPDRRREHDDRLQGRVDRRRRRRGRVAASSRAARTRTWARVRCAARSRSTSRTRSPSS